MLVAMAVDVDLMSCVFVMTDVVSMVLWLLAPKPHSLTGDKIGARISLGLRYH